MMPMAARPTNRMVDPEGGRVNALWIKCAPTTDDRTISAQSNKASSKSAPIIPPIKMRLLGKKGSHNRHREFSAGEKPGNCYRNFLEKECEQRADKSEHQCNRQRQQCRWFMNKVRRDLNASRKSNCRHAQPK